MDNNQQQQDGQPEGVVVGAYIDNYKSGWTQIVGDFMSFQMQKTEEYTKLREDLEKSKKRERDAKDIIKILCSDSFDESEESLQCQQKERKKEDTIKTLLQENEHLKSELAEKNKQVEDLTTEVTTARKCLSASEKARCMLKKQNQEMFKKANKFYEGLGQIRHPNFLDSTRSPAWSSSSQTSAGSGISDKEEDHYVPLKRQRTISPPAQITDEDIHGVVGENDDDENADDVVGDE